MNKKRMLALPLIAIMLSLTTAVAVAHWVDNLYVVGNVESGFLEACITDAFGKDVGDDWTSSPGMKEYWQLTKDIANTTLKFDCNLLQVTVNNGYPCYYNHINLEVQNTGTIPWAIYKVEVGSQYNQTVTIYQSEYYTLDLDGDGNPDIEIRYMDSFGDQKDPGDSADLSFKFHLMNPIPQDADCLSFFMRIYVVNWNEYESMLPDGQNPQ